MKIVLDFRSPLLKESMNLYLSEYISTYEESDFVISDHLSDSEKPIFLVSHNKDATLCVPFTQDKLFLSLKEFIYKHRKKSKEEIELDKIVEELDKKHKAKIEKLISDFYEKN